MEAFNHYLFISGIALIGFYLLYSILLRNQPNFALNRYFILFFLLVSLLFPLLNLRIDKTLAEPLGQMLTPFTLESLESIVPNRVWQPSLSILLIIYIAGVVFFAARFMLSLARLAYFFLRFPIVDYCGFKTILLKENQSPFTFFHYLFISEEDHQKGETDILIAHEKAHRNQYHSIDLIVLELANIIQWFNPFVWLFGKALKAEHEFFADQQVLKAGFDFRQYQQLLFEKSVGIKLNLANNFNYSPLKQRLKMMNLSRSKVANAVPRYSLAIPLTLMLSLTLLFSKQILAQDKEVFSEVDALPEYEGGLKGLYTFIGQNITYPKIARDNKMQARIYISFVVRKDGKVANVKIAKKTMLNQALEEMVVVGNSTGQELNNAQQGMDAISAEAVRVVKSLQAFSPGIKDGKKVNTQLVLPINFILKKG